jgi:hypothetical protein
MGGWSDPAPRIKRDWQPFRDMICLCVDRLFDDKRMAVALLMVWLIIVVTVFKDIGLLDTKFMTLGPSPNTIFMGMTLDTWYKWNLVAAFTFINTSINDFMSDAISPWILNTISDHKAKYLPYSKATCLFITQMWSIYCNIMSVFGLFLAMTQVDFVIIRMSADLTVNVYTTLKFMRNKVTSSERYKQDFGGGGIGSEMSSVSSFNMDLGMGDDADLPMLHATTGGGHETLAGGSSRSMFCIEEHPDENAGKTHRVKGGVGLP